MKAAVLLGLLLVSVLFEANANELTIELSLGKPTQKEFQIAAKRAFYARKYELWTVDSDVVTARYRGGLRMALIMGEDAIIIRTMESGSVSADQINKYIRNLSRELHYELAEYVLAPATTSDPDKIASLIGLATDTSVNTEDAGPGGLGVNISGTYVSRITTNSNWTFNKKCRKARITFAQRGDQVVVRMSDPAISFHSIEVVGANRIKFELGANSSCDASYLTGSWEISENGNGMSGEWNSSSANGKWDLTKVK